MTNVLRYAADAYRENLSVILIFSLVMLISFLIPVLASFPTYSDMGGIFLRTATTFTSINTLSITVIIISTLLSLLFLSFAVVAINVAVKHKRTHTRITAEVLRGLETYTGRVFAILLLYTVLVMIVGSAAYLYHVSQLITYAVALILSPLFFYAPSSIVIDDRGLRRAIQSSKKFFLKRFDYFVLWIIVAIALLTVFDLFSIAVGGSGYAGYLMLVFNSIFILPFLITLQSESYMKRFALLKN